MSDLVLYEGGQVLTGADKELLFERVATHYLALQDERGGRRVRIDEALGACLKLHPEYDPTLTRVSVRSKEFDTYLTARRKEHLLTTLVPMLYAAEMGSKMTELAGRLLIERLESGANLDTKDLLAVIRTGAELAAKVDKQVEQVTETQKIQVNLDLKGLLLGLPADMAQDYMAEVGRRMITGGEK